MACHQTIKWRFPGIHTCIGDDFYFTGYSFSFCVLDVNWCCPLSNMLYMNQTSRFKIAILRALQLGDLLCAIPAIRSLRAAYPIAEITLLSLPWAESFAKRFSEYFDRFIHFRGYPGLPEQPYSREEWEKFAETMREEQFDLVIQMQGNGTIVNSMLQNLNVKQLAGFYRADSP